jgi:two-component system, LytTR family, sensor kinase
MKISAKNILLHILGWGIFLSLPHFIFEMVGPIHHAPPDPGLPPPPPHTFMFLDVAIVSFNLSLIAFYYFNSLVLIPRLLGQRKRFWYALSIIACMLFVISVPSLASAFFHKHGMHPHNYQDHRLMTAIRILVTTLVFAIIFIISTGVRIIREWYSAEQENKQIQLEKTTAELSFLKAQINPHFLFNTLNNIYSLAVKKSENTAEAILLLADMMRYVLSDAQNDYVPLASETEYLSKYIELQKLRLTDKVKIVYNVSGEPDKKIIAPLILVPFIENAFKFGISTHEPSTIAISIRLDRDKLLMIVINDLFTQANQLERSSGIGLANVRRRLSLLYPERYKLDIHPNKEGKYIVELELNLAA